MTPRLSPSTTRPASPPFARELSELGVELIASGGTAQALADEGIPVTPARGAHGLRRAARPPRRDAPSRPSTAASSPAATCPTTSPSSRRTASRRSTSSASTSTRSSTRSAGSTSRWEEAIEQIDIGGPALLRARREEPRARRPALPARRTTSRSLEEFRVHGGRCPPATRRALAARAFATTAALRRGRRRLARARRGASRRRYVPSFDRVPRALVRREPAPAGRVLRPARRAHAPARARRAAAGQAALVQQPRRPLGGAAARASSSRARRP